MRGDAKVQAIDSRLVPANEMDWATENLDAVLSIKTVKNVNEAIEHINCYGSHHTDAIIAKDGVAAKTFLNYSAIVLHNMRQPNLPTAVSLAWELKLAFRPGGFTHADRSRSNN